MVDKASNRKEFGFLASPISSGLSFYFAALSWVFSFLKRKVTSMDKACIPEGAIFQKEKI